MKTSYKNLNNYLTLIFSYYQTTTVVIYVRNFSNNKQCYDRFAAGYPRLRVGLELET